MSTVNSLSCKKQNKTVLDYLSFVTWCIILLEAAMTTLWSESNNTQVGCSQRISKEVVRAAIKIMKTIRWFVQMA